MTKLTICEGSLGKEYKDDYWADTDEGMQDDSFEEIQDGHTFICCGQVGTTDGCQRYVHVAQSESIAN